MSLKDFFKSNNDQDGLKSKKLGLGSKKTSSGETGAERETDLDEFTSMDNVPDTFGSEAPVRPKASNSLSPLTADQDYLDASTIDPPSLNPKSVSHSVSMENLDMDSEAKALESMQTAGEFVPFDNESAFKSEEPQQAHHSFKGSSQDAEQDDLSFFNRLPAQEVSDGEMLPKKEKKKFSLSSLLKNRSSGKDMAGDASDFERTVTQTTEFDDIVESRRADTTASHTLSDESLDLRQKKLPLIGRFSVRNQYQAIVGALGLSLVSIGVSVYLNQVGTAQEAKAATIATRLLGDLQQFDNDFSLTTNGKKGALEEMVQSWESVKKEKNEFSMANHYIANDNIMDLSNKVEISLAKMEKHVQLVKSEEDFLKDMEKKITDIAAQTAVLSDLIDRLGIVYMQLGGSQSEMASIFFLKGALQSMNTSVTTILLSENVPPEILVNLNKMRGDFRKTLNELYYGAVEKSIAPMDPVVPMGTYKKLAQRWVKFANEIDAVVDRSRDLISIKTLAKDNSDYVKEVSHQLQKAIQDYDGKNYQGYLLSKILLLIGVLALIISSIALFYLYTFEKDNGSLLEKLENSRNQGSILRLLNEMMPLQDGDLTKKTTVSEEITGTIADSINATVDSLASLVKKIKDTSLAMREKTNEVRVISADMLRSNEQQADSISSTGSSVIEISKAINTISDKTKESAQKAQSSVEVATAGAIQVHASIDSMQAIDHNMTETGLLMKKVSDSSKQISEIVNLLSDITEETNILALNATVQAAKAGEAGKGFKIVADSIQELADKAADANRRVGALIAAVQTDIQSVGVSIEKTTQEVQKGVDLSEKAGKSLAEITKVSNDLAQIINVISKDASRHAETSRQISTNMEKILQVSEENKSSTKKTATSITEIAEISNELGESVQSFKVE